MMSEFKELKKFIGVKFGYGENVLDGVYAVPTKTSKGNAFFKAEFKDNNLSGEGNFKLFWDEDLKFSWYDSDKPLDVVQSEFSRAFRKIVDLT